MEDLAASADGLVISLRRADADLSAVMHRLETEFQQRFKGREVMKAAAPGTHPPSIRLGLALNC